MIKKKINIVNNKVVRNYLFGSGSINNLTELLMNKNGIQIFLIDHYFIKNDLLKKIHLNKSSLIYIVDSSYEITTDLVDEFVKKINDDINELPSVIIGIGGGSTLDMAKAVSNLLTNPGKASDYQGWDLVKYPGVYKIGVPTLSGTGAEASRTCVMINPKNGLKLGMNSEHTIFDQLILDPSLTKTVPRDQYFYSGMDTMIHCLESLNGNFRHLVSDAYSREAMKLCAEVFGSDDMMSAENRSKLMVASYFGGTSIANSYVGIIHPFSAGLSVVLGIHHCEANCITMRGMEEFYPKEFKQFWEFAERQKIVIRKDVCQNLSKEQYLQLYNSTIIHEKPLINALGKNFKVVLSKEKVIEIFKKM
jgi:3-deoxy-alpha-D-manno-octulosonate 8-oxidase